MTAVDVLQRAFALSQRQHFDCPMCACARAKTELDGEIEDVDVGQLIETIEILRQYLVGAVTPLDSDAPLEEAVAALRPYLSEIVGCPSPLSDERMREILEYATASVGKA